MKLLVLSSRDLHQLLDLDELRQAMRSALISVSSRKTRSFLRHVTPLSSKKLLGLMPAFHQELNLVGYKSVSVFSQNATKGINPHQGFVTLLDHETGRPKCLLEGSTITALRTAAVSAVATDLFSHPNSTELAIIGAGRQAAEHIRSLCRIRPIRKIRIYGRDPNQVQQLIQNISGEALGFIEIAESPRQAVEEADIVVTCTSSSEALLCSSDFKPGAHINAVGACRPGFRELNVQTQPHLKIFLDHRESCFQEADEIFRPLHGLSLESQIVGEIGAVLNQEIPGRRHHHETTLFKSVGLAAEDLFAAHLAFTQAQIQGRGCSVDFT